MKKYLILFIILIFLIGCNSEGSTKCDINNDCKSVSGSTTGCFNKYDLPAKKSGFGGKLGPSECSCIDNRCVNTGMDIDSCFEFLCVGGGMYKISKSEIGVFTFAVFNQDDKEQLFHVEVIASKAIDSEKNEIENNLIPILEKNDFSLDSKSFEKQQIFVKTDEQTPSGMYLFNLVLENQNKSIKSLKKFYLNIE
jgi:hypothetical protein